MNAKKAKALRRLVKNAQKINEDLKNAQEYTENVSKRKMLTYEDIDETGNHVSKDIAISQGQITVNPASPRGLYLHFKKSIS